MGDPVRKSSDPFPSSPGDIVPRDLGSDGASRQKPQDNPRDPSLFGDQLPLQAPLLDSNPWAPTPPSDDLAASTPSGTSPLTNAASPSKSRAHSVQETQDVKSKLRRNRRRGISFTLLIFGAIGLIAFGAGASMAYFILSGALDLDQSWIKENLNVIKGLVKDWRQ